MRTILVECQTLNSSSKINELKDLAESRGYLVVAKLTQRKPKPDPAFVIGRGKLEELKKLVEEFCADNVIFANTLKAGQAFRIRRELGWTVNVIDRNLLVLEIFEQRALTREAKLQIELAKLRYTLPWAREFVRYRNLYGEQVGFSAMGEYLHEVYEANARRRIKALEEELKKIRSKALTRILRRREAGLPVITITGYTQAGKTTFFNLLTGESKPVGLGPFTTLSTFARRIRLLDLEVILVDSIGFIEDLHPLILNAFHATLSELGLSDEIALVVDVSDPLEIVKRRLLTCKEILYQVAPGVPLVVLLNKIDLVEKHHLDEATDIVTGLLPSSSVAKVSALLGINVEEAASTLRACLDMQRRNRNQHYIAAKA
ncbi:MAG: GTPase HflX [Candidatus Nezhaarchaeota archaeon]|nr:GTPase HflX [Candidatus Nezhaarchaeota archaeon]